MNKRFVFLIPILLFAGLFRFYLSSDEPSAAEISQLRQMHREFLQTQVPEKGEKLSRLERIRKGLPPNRYYQMMEYLTMNPALGYPEPYKVRELYQKLSDRRNTYKAPGGEDSQPWISRGPFFVGGRTRVLLFDPNDPEAKRVFAGSVSGGLWVNDDITTASSKWRQVSGLSSNLNITCITVDPRDANTWYVGTGEQYTGGDVIGTGVFKTSDGGQTWSQVLDVKAFSTPSQGSNSLVVGGLYYINDIQAWDNGTSTEVFIGVSSHLYANARNPNNFLGFFDRGLYRSLNGGSTWEQLIEEDSFNDFEVSANGDLWVATTYSVGESGSRGGKIYKREKGTNTSFDLITTIPNVYRTEIEASATDPEKFYIAVDNIEEEADLFITTDAFASITKINEPNDADLEILSFDFARGQAFYDLVIESDPNDDRIVYAGGIDLFRSTDSGNSWQQISKWSDNDNLDNLPVSFVHADHHVISFRPGNSNQAAFGHDGGVSFARDLSKAASSDVFISPLEDYVTTQFYSIAVAPSSFANGDYFLGGTQDNGTQLIQNGSRESIGVLGGDGAHSFYDQVDTDYLIANLIYNNLILAYDYSQEGFTLIANNEDDDGFFINPQALDSNLDKLYSNGPRGIIYRYDNLNDLKLIGSDGITDDDEVAPRVSLTNAELSSSISAITVSPFDVNTSTVFVGLTDGSLIKIKNADGNPSLATFTEITGPQFVGSVSDIEFGQTRDEILVTFYNFGVKNIWYTEDGSSDNPTWVSKEGNLPDLPVLTILPNPLNNDEVIIGTDLGVWATKNFTSTSPSWTHSYNGMSDVKVTDLDLKKGNNEVYAASYGRGMFTGQFTAPPPGQGGGEPDQAQLVVYPAVSDGNYEVLSRVGLGTAEIQIFDLTGQLVYSQKEDLEENIPVPINIEKEASGVYFIRIKSSSKEVVHKIVRK